MNGADELAHQVKHAAQQQTGDYRPFAFGHIATWSATQGVRLIIPSMRDEAGNPVLTGWMPLGSMFAGGAWGMQIAPLGGATLQNPTAGELCIVAIMDKTNGLMATLCLAYNQVNTAPFPNLQPGEIGIMGKSGSSMQFKKNGDVDLSAIGNINIVVASAKNILIGAGGTLLALVNSMFQAFFNAHVHSNSGAGPPTVMMPDNNLTTVVQAQ